MNYETFALRAKRRLCNSLILKYLVHNFFHAGTVSKMIVTYSCDHCSQSMTADETLSGRTVTCPRCRHATVLRLPAERNVEFVHTNAQIGSTDELLNETHGGNSESATSEGLSDALTKGTSRCAQHDLRFVLTGESTHNREIAELCDAMRTVVPCFQPNPFCISYPLDKTAVADFNDDSDSIGRESSSANPYDVDELIKGVEKPDGGF